MTKEEVPLVVATPSRWPYRVAYVLALLTLVGAFGAWVEVAEAESRREAVLASVDQAEQNGADNHVLRSMMASYRDHRKEAMEWSRRRLGLFLAFLILFIGGFIGTGLVNLHEKMVWQVRENKTLEDEDYGGK